MVYMIYHQRITHRFFWRRSHCYEQQDHKCVSQRLFFDKNSQPRTCSLMRRGAIKEVDLKKTNLLNSMSSTKFLQVSLDSGPTCWVVITCLSWYVRCSVVSWFGDPTVVFSWWLKQNNWRYKGKQNENIDKPYGSAVRSWVSNNVYASLLSSYISSGEHSSRIPEPLGNQSSDHIRVLH